MNPCRRDPLRPQGATTVRPPDIGGGGTERFQISSSFQVRNAFHRSLLLLLLIHLHKLHEIHSTFIRPLNKHFWNQNLNPLTPIHTIMGLLLNFRLEKRVQIKRRVGNVGSLGLFQVEFNHELNIFARDFSITLLRIGSPTKNFNFNNLNLKLMNFHSLYFDKRLFFISDEKLRVVQTKAILILKLIS